MFNLPNLRLLHYQLRLSLCNLLNLRRRMWFLLLVDRPLFNLLNLLRPVMAAEGIRTHWETPFSVVKHMIRSTNSVLRVSPAPAEGDPIIAPITKDASRCQAAQHNTNLSSTQSVPPLQLCLPIRPCNHQCGQLMLQAHE